MPLDASGAVGQLLHCQRCGNWSEFSSEVLKSGCNSCQSGKSCGQSTVAKNSFNIFNSLKVFFNGKSCSQETDLQETAAKFKNRCDNQ